MRQELQKRAAELESEIASTKETLDGLLKRRDFIDPTTPLQDIERTTSQIKAYGKRLEDAQLLQMAIEKRLREYQAKEPEAAETRKYIAAKWDEMRPHVEALIEHQRGVAETLTKIGPLQAEIGALAAKHLALTDDPLNLQRPIFRVPRHVVDFANLKLTPLAPWRYLTEEQRRAEKAVRLERERQAAIERAPLCKKCDKRMTLRDPPKIGTLWAYECRECRSSQEVQEERANA